MLSLMMILSVIGLVLAIRKWKKDKPSYCKIFIYIFTIILLALYFIWFGMFIYVQKDDTGYFQQQVDVLTEVNEQMEDRIEIIEYELSDYPDLVNFLEEYLNDEIKSNNEEISKYMVIKDYRIKQYRWLLYFG